MMTFNSRRLLLMIYTTFLSTFSFGQTPNNLVQNPSFETNTCGILPPPTQSGSCYSSPFNTPTCVNDWLGIVGTPKLCASYIGNGAADGTLFAECSISNNLECKTEAFAQNLNKKLFAGQPYSFSYLTRIFDVNGGENLVNVSLFGVSTTWNSIFSYGGLGACPPTNGWQQIHSQNIPVSSTWKELSGTYTPNIDLNSIVFLPIPTAPNQQSSVHFDRFKITCTSLMTVNFSATNSNGLTFQFTDLSNTTIQGLSAESWFWEFGDGTTSTQQNPLHTFPDEKTREVCLTITDNRGCTSKFCDFVSPLGAFCYCTEPVPFNDRILLNAGNGTLWSSFNLKDHFTNACISISGKLIIDKDVTFDFSQIRMRTGAEIEVQSTKTLKADDSIFEACEKMWKGITVKSGGKIDIINSEFFDAENAIKFEDGSRIILLDGNDFYRNLFGINVSGNVVIENPNEEISNNFFIGGQLIANYPGMTPALRSKSAVFLNSCTSNFNMNGPTWGTHIEGFIRGVDVRNSKFFSCNNYFFQQCDVCIYGANTNITANYNLMKWGCGTGIYVGMSSNKSLNFKGNQISAANGIGLFSTYNCSKNINLNIIEVKSTKTGYGINVSLAQKRGGSINDNIITYDSGEDFNGIILNYTDLLNLNHNTLNASNTTNGIPLNVHGIKLLNSKNSLLTLNSVTGSSLSNGNSYYVSGSPGWFLCNNSSENSKNGILFASNCKSDIKYHYNHLKSHSVGLKVDPSSVIGLQYIKNFQNNQYFFTGLSNQWEMNQYPVQTGVYADPNVDKNTSGFKVHSPTPSNYLPAVIDAPPGFFDNDASMNQIFGGCGQSSVESPTDVNILIARNQVSIPRFGAATSAQLQRDLYRDITTGTLVTTPNSVLDSFYQANTNTNIGKLTQIENQFNAYLSDVNPSNMLHSIMLTNDAIVPTSIWEENEKRTNAILMQKWMAQDWTFTENEQMDVLSIAAQCPRSNGLAVYTARAIYRFIDNTVEWDDEVLCSFDNSSAVATPHAANKAFAVGVRINPNPASDEIRIELPDEQTVYGIELVDMTGKSMLKTTIVGSRTFDVAALASGFYFCKVTQDGKLIQTTKLIKIKN